MQEEQDPHFEPVIKLTEQVETKTNEEDEEAIFKMCVSHCPICTLFDLTNAKQARKTVPLRLWLERVEGTRDGRGPSAAAQADEQGTPRHAPRQDPQGLREPPQSVFVIVPFTRSDPPPKSPPR